MAQAKIVQCGEEYYLATADTEVWDIESVVEQLQFLSPSEKVELTIYNIEYETESDESHVAEDLQVIADNIVDMLNDDVVLLLSCDSYELSGVENRNRGAEVHIEDIKSAIKAAIS